MANIQGACEECAHYIFDDEYEGYICDMDMDEDEYIHFLQGNGCPYYQKEDEYGIVRKQN